MQGRFMQSNNTVIDWHAIVFKAVFVRMLLLV